jgi:hypothetical protein
MLYVSGRSENIIRFTCVKTQNKETGEMWKLVGGFLLRTKESDGQINNFDTTF